jgi:phytochrome-interacting factor 4
MPPPKSTHVSGSQRQQQSMSMSLADNAGELSDLVQARAGKAAAVEEGASSTLSAIGASFCGSNQVQVQRGAASEQGRAGTTAYGGGSAMPSAMGSGNANALGRGHEATAASSSGRSNYYCFGGATTTTTTTTTTTGTEPTSTSNLSSKRKRGLDTDYSTESPSEVRLS